MRWLATLAAVVVTGCSEAPVSAFVGGTGEVDAGCGCSAFGPAVKVGTVAPVLVELSGLAASRTQPGIYWAHNDSGDAARFFAMRLDGTVAQQFAVSGASHVDWEDIALGPCPSGTCVFIADVGDNFLVRTTYDIYRVPEPVVGGPSALSAERFSFTYPDGPHSAEALLVAPSGEAYVITKELAGSSAVFRLSFEGLTQVAVKVATLTFPLAADSPVTAADLSPCGDVIAVRMYNRLVKLVVPDGQPLEAAFSEAPGNFPSPSEVQGEAVAFSADGRALVLASESLATASPVWQAECRP